jgi:hypothetical protein
MYKCAAHLAQIFALDLSLDGKRLAACGKVGFAKRRPPHLGCPFGISIGTVDRSDPLHFDRGTQALGYSSISARTLGFPIE